MNGLEASVKNASTLIYKAVNTNLTTGGDVEYRELTALFRLDPTFRNMCEDVAAGQRLLILDAVETRGLVVVPDSRESRYAVRLSDIRATGLDQGQKAALVLAHIAICAVFFPTSDALDDDDLTPTPTTLAVCRDTLFTLATRLREGHETQETSSGIPAELQPGWDAICALPLTLRETVRAAPSSVSGIVKIALNQMKEGNLVRLDRGAEDDPQASYTANHRLRVQLREIALRRLFEMAQHCAGRR